MVDLSTNYLGLKLRNPLVPSSSPLSRHLDSARRLEDAGAGALVMHSLFEERVEEEGTGQGHYFQPRSTTPDQTTAKQPVATSAMRYEEQYLEHLAALKSSLEIPVIASLNGTTPGGWVDYASALQEAGADALELNVYYLPALSRETGTEVEDRYVEILESLREQISIPIAMKLSSQFSSVVYMAQRLQRAGADGLVLFNRFYQPDIDLETLEVVPRLELSNSGESLLRIRWIAILHGRVDCSLAITGGVHNVKDVLKSLLAGADVTHMCSALLRRGPGHLAMVLRALEYWLEERGYESVQQIKGSVSQRNATDSSAFLRANYMRVLDSYQPPP